MGNSQVCCPCDADAGIVDQAVLQAKGHEVPVTHETAQLQTGLPNNPPQVAPANAATVRLSAERSMSHHTSVVTRVATQHLLSAYSPYSRDLVLSHCGFTFLHLQTVGSTAEIGRKVDMFDAAKKGRIEDIRFAISVDPDLVNTKSSVTTLRYSPVHSNLFVLTYSQCYLKFRRTAWCSFLGTLRQDRNIALPILLSAPPCLHSASMPVFVLRVVSWAAERENSSSQCCC